MRIFKSHETTTADFVKAHDEITTSYETALFDLLNDVVDRRETIASRLSALESEARELARLESVL